MVLICISLMPSEFEHFFMCLLAICVFLGEMSVHVFCPFLIGVFIFGGCFLSCICSLYILDTNPSLARSFTNIFSHSVDCLLVLLVVSFAVQKLFILM